LLFPSFSAKRNETPETAISAERPRFTISRRGPGISRTRKNTKGWEGEEEGGRREWREWDGVAPAAQGLRPGFEEKKERKREGKRERERERERERKERKEETRRRIIVRGSL